MAYVVTKCRTRDGVTIGSQELRVQTDRRDPVTVLRLEDPTPLPDPVGICLRGADNRSGRESPVAGLFQRLGVTPDGSGVAFKISNEFQLIGPAPLPPEQQGFFFVRTDGTGLRRLRGPSRDPTFRVFVDNLGGLSANTVTKIAFSTDGSVIAYTDVGPGTDGRESEQIFATDLASGETAQLTEFSPKAPPPPGLRHIQVAFFAPIPPIPRRVAFVYREGDTVEPLVVDVSTRSSLPLPVPSPGEGRPGAVVDPAFHRSVRRLSYEGIEMPSDPDDPNSPRYIEYFRQFGPGELVQLTNFRRLDTALVALRIQSILFLGSADPLGTNPHHNCQVFRVASYGGKLRQLTRFGTGVPARFLCNSLGDGASCGMQMIGNVTPEDTNRPLAFYSDCDPLGSNPSGTEVFSIRWDGSGLQQLTRTSGIRREPDGWVEVELPGPVARGGR